MAYDTIHYTVDCNGYEGTSVLIVRTGDSDESIPEPERGFDSDLMVRILLIGDSGVGKSCLLSRFALEILERTIFPNLSKAGKAENMFTDIVAPTIGIDYKLRTIELDGKIINMQIWDTSGQERFDALTQCYFRGAQGVAVVYDVTDQNSFRNLGRWLDQVDAYGEPWTSRLLIGNKCDLAAEREVEYTTAKEYADMHGMILMETSAKNSINVNHAFVQLAIDIKQRLSDREFQYKQSLKLQSSTHNTQNSRGCCWL